MSPKKTTKFLALSLTVLTLASCGGGGGGSHPSPPTPPGSKPNAPTQFTATPICNNNRCTSASFNWNQGDYKSGEEFATHISYSVQGQTSGQTVVSTLSGTTGSQTVTSLTPNETYDVKYYTTNQYGQSPVNITTFSTQSQVNPQDPTNIKVTSSCQNQSACTLNVSFDQPNSSTANINSSNALQDTVTITDSSGKSVYSKTVDAQTTGNQLSIDNVDFTSGKHYTLTITNGNRGKAVLPFSPEFIYSNGAYVYNTRYDLTGSGNSYASAEGSEFQNLNLSDLYIDSYSGIIGDPRATGATLPDPSNYNNDFDSYYQKAVANSCAKKGNPGLTYYGTANATIDPDTGKDIQAGNCVDGTAITAAYAKWPHNQSDSILKNLTTRVMSLVETYGRINPKIIGDASSQAIDFLARAIAKTINDDPNAAGVTFDVEFDGTIANSGMSTSEINNWYQFLANVVKYMHQDAPSSSQQKYVSIFANDDVLEHIVDGNGDNLFKLFGSTNSQCGNKCYIIVPRYDFGGINPWNIFDTEQSLDQLVNSSTPKQSFSYQAGSGLTAPAGGSGILNHLFNNKDYFQIAMATSGSWSTWASSYLYRTDDEPSKNQIQASANVTIDPTGCNAAKDTKDCSSLVTQKEGSTQITQKDYVCDSLLAYLNAYQGGSSPATTLNGGGVSCSFVGNTQGITSAANDADSTNMKKYFMGLAMYQISNPTVDAFACSQAKFLDKACNVAIPADMNEMIGNDGSYENGLELVNVFTNKLSFPAETNTTSSASASTN